MSTKPLNLRIRCKPCSVCGETATVLVHNGDYDMWHAGAYIQDAFPDLSIADRELLISGTHPDCWKALWGK